MHYYIDGYNLLFRLLRYDSDLRKQREQIIQNLSVKIEFLGLDATLVFDSQYQEGESTRGHLKSLEIFFTSEGETADEFIIQELKNCKDPRKETVVTSDKKLAWRARRKAAQSESVEAFVEWLNIRCRNKRRNLQAKRQQTESLAPTSPPSASAETMKTAPPSKAIPLESCSEYYASVFENKFNELAKEENDERQKKIERKAQKSKKRKTKPIEKEADFRSQEEKWLEIFEKRLVEDTRQMTT